MVSWAVPKGPSLNPADKRLAIQTEDHPLEYSKFEGVIPAGNYGAGDVIIWDNGTFDPEGGMPASAQLERGELKFTMHGHKLNGSFVLVKLRNSKSGKSEWLLIKHRDQWADANWNIAEHGGSVVSSDGDSSGKKRVWHSNRPAKSGKGGAKAGADDSRQPKKSQAAVNPSLLKGARKAPMPEYIIPALASLSEKPFSDPAWLFEIKWDGVRTLANVQKGKTRLWSRTRREITREYPEISGVLGNQANHELWLDGEIVALDGEGRSDFQLLQQRMSIVNPGAALMEHVYVVYYVFDVLYCDGYDLRQAALIDRKALLKEVLPESEQIRYSDHQIEKGKELFELAVKRHLEGILAKQVAGPYPQGRTTAWLKFKLTRELDAVVGGWTAPRRSRQHFGALLVGLYDGKKLEFIAGVGSGFPVTLQKRLAAQLDDLHSEKSPFAAPPSTQEEPHWVKPELVARIKFGGWTEGRHLRQPTFLGLREDIKPADCTFTKETAPPAEPDLPKSGHKPWKHIRRSAAAKLRNAVAVIKSPKIAAPASGAPLLTAEDEIGEELKNGSSENLSLELDGKPLHLTHLNKVYFPDDGYTKRNLLEYYFRVAPLILPFLKDRPLVLRRYPNGIKGEAFFQKDAGKGVPEWMKTVSINSEDKNRPIRYFLADDRASLLYLTNLGCIDHNPWSSRAGDIEHPDYIFFDLDPGEDATFASVAKLAGLLTAKLHEIGMTVFLKTSGASGLHLFLPIEPHYTYEQARQLVQTVALLVAGENPRLITTERSVRKRPRASIYVDAHQNSQAQSLAAVYSVRAFSHAPISTPIEADELNSKLRPDMRNLKTIWLRLEKKGDLWAGFWKARQRLEPAVKRLEKLL